MSYVKSGIIVLAAFAFCAPSVAQAQGYKQRGTRTGAIAGAIIGGLIGAGNDEALAGAAIGGVVGGITGRAVGRSRDAQYRYGGYGHGYYEQPGYYHRGYGGGQRVQMHYVPAAPVYRNSSYGSFYRGGGYSGRSYCPNRGW